jgi:hypothetical protein
MESDFPQTVIHHRGASQALAAAKGIVLVLPAIKRFPLVSVVGRVPSRGAFAGVGQDLWVTLTEAPQKLFRKMETGTATEQRFDLFRQIGAPSLPRGDSILPRQGCSIYVGEIHSVEAFHWRKCNLSRGLILPFAL